MIGFETDGFFCFLAFLISLFPSGAFIHFFPPSYPLHFYSIFTIFLSTSFSFASYTVGFNDVNAIHDLTRSTSSI